MNGTEKFTPESLLALAARQNLHERLLLRDATDSAEVAQNIARRLMRRITVNENGCWVWGGCVAKPGYGRMGTITGTTAYTHRIAFELVNGTIPTAMSLDHLCRNTLCANPSHLECVTHRENVLRGVSYCSERHSSTHCVNGHEFTIKNTYITSAGHRQCRKCNRLNGKRYYHSRNP